MTTTTSPVRNKWLDRLVDEATFDFYAKWFSSQWRWRRVICRVERIEPVASDMLAFTLKPNGNWQGFLPGQHLQVYAEIDGVRHSRSYSLTNVPTAAGHIEFAVKQVANGLMSNWLQQHVKVGDYLEVGQAFGDISLPSADPLLMIAGGSGITPVMSWLRMLADQPRADVVLLQYARDAATLPFQPQIKTLQAQMPGLRHIVVLTDEAGQPSAMFGGEQLDTLVPDAAQRAAFACGPASLTDAVRALWQQRQYRRPLATEAFTPPKAVNPDAAYSVQLNFRRAGSAMVGSSATPLLQQAEQHGLKPASGCRMGICFSCVCKKESGTVHNLLSGKTSSEPGEMIRLCVSTPVSDVVLDL